jgi:hypothetical protein
MNVKQILGRGIQETVCKDESFSYTGLRDFKEEAPEILKLGPKPGNSRPRTKVSQNNSYT